MKIKHKILAFLCLCHAAVFGQGTIKGKIRFPATAETVLVQLLSQENNTLVKTQLNEADGSFTFIKLNPGNYIITTDDDKFKPYQSKAIVITAQNPEVILPDIILTASDVRQLGEVVLRKKKMIVENKIDKTVVNVDAMITAAGGDAMEVLEKSPGITVDQNGTITFKGKSGVAVFIDDKPSYLSGAELEAYLKSLPASTLSQIELMTNPPAKYDAAGSAGIINIITKKSKARGFNGSATSRYWEGRRPNARESINLNYLDGKIHLSGNVANAYYQNHTNLYIFRRFRNEDLTTKSFFDENSSLDGKTNASSGKIGIDYYVSDKTTLGANLSGLVRRQSRHADVNSTWSDASRVLDSTIAADNATHNRFENWDANVNFRHDFKKGKISADADYLNYTNDSKQGFRNFTYQPDNSLSSQDESAGHLPSDIDIVSLKTDYSYPLKNGGAFEAGYKASISKTDNIADYRNIVSGNSVPDYDLSNHFNYAEIINAAYANFNTGFKRFSFQTGLRLENTQSKGDQLGNPEKPASQFRKDYTNLFPTVYVQYKLDSIGNNQLVTSYGKRINRPYYEDLNPFVSPLDKFTFYAGNPYLNPSFSHNFELSYRYKSYLSTTLTYTFTKDDIDETIEINDGIYYSRPGNIGKNRVLGFNVNAEIPFADWLSTSIYSEVNYLQSKSRLYTENLDSSGTYWYVSVNNQLKFGKNWSAELSGTYQTKVTTAQFVLGPRGGINVGVQKKILKGQGSLKLSGNDIFYGNINTGTINNLHLTDATWINKVDTRFVSLAFTYSFGKAFQPKNDYDATGADTEKNRVKG